MLKYIFLTANIKVHTLSGDIFFCTWLKERNLLSEPHIFSYFYG